MFHKTCEKKRPFELMIGNLELRNLEDVEQYRTCWDTDSRNLSGNPIGNDRGPFYDHSQWHLALGLRSVKTSVFANCQDPK